MHCLFLVKDFVSRCLWILENHHQKMELRAPEEEYLEHSLELKIRGYTDSGEISA